MSGPFSGFGISSDLKLDNFLTSKDPYYIEINKILDKENILKKYSSNDTKKLQKKLLYPYLEFFIRNDNNNYYKNLFYNRGLAKNNKGDLNNDLELQDLVKLRVHSDDLRGEGQKSRLMKHEN